MTRSAARGTSCARVKGTNPENADKVPFPSAGFFVARMGERAVRRAKPKRSSMLKRLLVVVPALLALSIPFATSSADAGERPVRVAQNKKKKPAKPAPPAAAEETPAPTGGDSPWGQTAQEKKAVKESIAKADAELAKARTACGNPNLAYKIDWSQYGKFEEAMSKENDRTKPNIYGLAGDLVGEVLDDLARVCADADYKKAAATLKVVSFTPTYTKGISSSKCQTFKRAGAALNVSYDAQVSSGGGAAENIRTVL